MVEEKISQECRLENIEEINNGFVKEIDQNELMNKKYKKVCVILIYIANLLILAFVVTGCVSISLFAYFLGIAIGIMGSAMGLQIRAITKGIKNYKSIIRKKKERHDKIVLLAKIKLSSLKVLISKALIVSYIIGHDEFVLVKTVWKEYNDMTEKIQKS